MPRLRDVKDQLGSLYLQSHVDNPVEWWTWGNDALDEARRLDRPVFLSIGYAACHWCHVMAHESFEDPAVAQLLNEGFIAIKVDREERPDVDALYMAATQLVSGHGGWPMSVFLLADGRPFMAGTYYPPEDRHGQVGFTRLLLALRDAWTDQREAVEAQATELQSSLGREVRFVDHLAPLGGDIDLVGVRRRLRDELVSRVDEFDDAPTRHVVELTLNAMARRGLYDHLRGGFARYSVDAIWHVPHFEKMLSDQALLVRAYQRAATAYGGREEWRAVAFDTLDFVLDDLRVPDGFASALDADAGGVEGSHVTWTPDEVRVTLATNGLADDLAPTLARWRISAPGEFEGRSIPRLAEDEPFTTPPHLLAARDALRSARAKRVQPSRDEKVILEWNAMFASALLQSGASRYVERGTDLLTSLRRTHFVDGVWWRTQSRNAHATASDVAWMTDALIDAYESTGEDPWLARADESAAYLLAHYWDGTVPTVSRPHEGAGFFSTSDLVIDLSTRAKEIFDSATPSSHAVACRALARLSLCRGDGDSLVVAQRLVELAATLLVQHPGAVVDLVDAAGFALEGVEVVVPGPENDLTRLVRSRLLRRSVLVTGSGTSALLAGRRAGLAYVCRGGVCQLPVASVEELDAALRNLEA
jgi:uncharacterized protein YyaL (SSP411 family)